MPEPAALGKNGTFVVLRKFQSRVGCFNAFLKAHGETSEERELLAAKMFGRWRSGAPLTLSPDHDDPALGADPLRNNDFISRTTPRAASCRSAAICVGSIRAIRADPADRRQHPSDHPPIFDLGPVYSEDVSPEDDAKGDRGIFFIFISARAYDTIEFMQQEWINRGNFVDLAKSAIRRRSA
jgi:deferrochelatase/peroxidase EfeB